MDILLAPIYSFFSLPFYKRIVRSTLGKGFLYLFYLSCLFAVIVTIFVKSALMPQADQFMGWLVERLPAMTLTKEGVVSDVQQPFELVHPKYGSILVMDTAKTTIENAPSTFVYVTKTKALVRQERRGETRVYDLTPQTDEARANWKDTTIDGPALRKLYVQFAPYAYPVTFVVVAIMVFFWKLMGALIYSVVALLLNLLRKPKLEYARLLNIAMFALTPVTVLQAIGFFVPRISSPLNFVTSLVLTGFYLGIAILATQDKPDVVEAPRPAA